MLENLCGPHFSQVIPWSQRASASTGRRIVVHAGSGREIGEVAAFCTEHQLVLVDLATTAHLVGQTSFPVVVCPNVNLLMLRFMAMLQSQGTLFASYEKSLLESHQAAKVSEPGTALSLARSLALDPETILSVRDPAVQKDDLGIPAEFLSRHALHRIQVSDGSATLVMETKVLGQAPYSSGLAQILEGLLVRDLEPGIHDVVTLVQNGWI